MAATGGGKIRSRRSHIASKPYAKNKQQQTGLISRVTDTVKSIVPGWLQRYFNNEEGSPGASVQGTEQNCEVTLPPNGSEEGPPPLDGRDSPEPSTSTAEPSTSRASLNFQEYVLSRPPLSRSHLHFPPLDTTSPALGTSTGLFSQPSTSSAPGPFSTGFSLVKEIKDNLSQHEDDNISTTSGFSSRASDKDVPNSKTASLPQLWSPETDRTNSGPQSSQASLKKPSFNLSVFGNSSNSTLNSTILNSSQLGDSPFYPGKTTYGGAAAVRSARTRPGTPYQAPVRRQIKAKPAGVQPCGVTSATARRILQSLERMSSPLADARRIPSTTASSLSASLEGTNVEVSPFQAKKKRMENLPPVQKLTVPSAAPLATNRSVSFRPTLTPGAGSRTLDRTPRDTPTRQSPQLPEMTPSLSTFGSGAQGYPLSSTPAASATGSGGGKMKRERSTARPPSKRQYDDEGAEAPDLPAISLPISSSALPTFTFSSPVPPPTTTTSNSAPNTLTGTPVKETNKLVNKESTVASTPPSVPFTFSSPIVKATAASPPSFSPTAGYTFSAPVAKLGPSMSNGSPSASVSASVKPVTTKSTEEFEGPFKPAKTLKTGSVLDLLKDPGFSSVTPKASAADVTSKASTPSSTSTISSSSGLSDLFKPQPGWSCDVCLVRNKPTDMKCVCCLTPQPNTSSSKPAESKPSAPPSTGNSSSSAGFGTLFSKPTGTWDCDTCLVHNKPEAVKCVACETAKPGTGLTSSLTLPSAFSAVKTVSPTPETVSTGTVGFGDMFKPPEGSWKCDVCMVQNKAEDSKCVACTTPKPGVSGTTTTVPPEAVSSAEPSLVSTTPVFGFGDKFKAPEGSWKCDTCMVQNKAEDSKCVACTTPNPGASGTTTTASPVATSSAAPSLAISTPVFGFGDKFKPPEGSWKCDVCMVQNKAEESKCVACTTPKPGVSGTTTTALPVATSSAAPSLPSFGDQFKKPEGSWKCDTCLVCNKPDDVQCVACQTPKPGAKVESKALGTSFGSSAAETSSSSPFGSSVSCGIKFGTTDNGSSGSGGFKFGGSFPDSSLTSGGFKFGTSFGSSSSETKDTTASSGFKFGASSEGFKFGTSSTDDKKSEQPAATSGFKFGNVGGISFGTGSSSTENGSSKGGFTFGLSKPEEKCTDSTSTPATVSFAPSAEKSNSPAPSTTALSDSSTSTINKPTTGSLFGGLATSTTSGSVTFGSLSAEKETPTPTFSFGKPEEKKEGSPASSTFIFGGASKDPAPAPAPASTAGFSFGKTPATADQPAFTFGKPADKSESSTTEPSKPVFVCFGQSAPDSTAAQKTAFSFMASNPTTNSTSSSTSTPTASLFGNGNTSAPAAAPSPVPSTFIFGQTASSSTDPPQTKAFVFGQSQDSQPAAPSALNPTQAPAQPFIFGASTNAASAAPSFNFGGAVPPAVTSTAPSAAPSPFVFNSAPSGSFGANQTPSFGSSFGSPFPPQSSQPLAFGANANTASVFGQTNSAPVFAAANSTPAGGGFQFGGAGAFGASNTGSGVFTFGAGSASPAPSATPAIAPQPGTAPGGFNFSQAPAFNIGSNKFSSPGGQAIPGRRIKTAVRRRK
ncbi:nuclear pore complex protein Nup153 isoform X3 [Periophthalmus magnuspinnatus]|uniref:nuclear pore complex protein Nup153 isoform X3 n=1 Tax=Periophthalmus magnuspinnatus TaxID=409849 RepID=UPI00145AF76F|nr:nuclear pore complex protein Nup153 isoform X3 [Periophthalmus magnuspinnatus]